MRIHLTSVVLAALTVPTCQSFQMVMMNYLNNLGGGQKPGVKQAWSPPSGSNFSPSFAPQQQPAPAAPAPQPMEQPPPPPQQQQQPETYMYSDESGEPDVMQAMNELTDTFVKNEEATLLALKEISSSMRLLAEQSAKLQAQVDAGPSAAPAAPAPLPPPVAAVVPPPAAPAPAAPAVAASNSGSYLDAMGGSSAAAASSSGPKKSYAVSGGKFKTAPSTGSYLDNVGSAPMAFTPTAPAPAPAQAFVSPPAAPAPAPAFVPPPAAPMGTGQLPDAILQAQASSGQPSATQGSSIVPPMSQLVAGGSAYKPPPLTTPVEPTPPTPDTNYDDIIGNGLSLTIAGLGLLWALTSSNDYSKNVPDFSIKWNGPSLSSFKQVTDGVAGGMASTKAETSNGVAATKPEPAIPAPAAVVVPAPAPAPVPLPAPTPVPAAPSSDAAAKLIEKLKAEKEAEMLAGPAAGSVAGSAAGSAAVSGAATAAGAASSGAAAATAGAATAGATATVAAAAPKPTGGSTFSYDPGESNGPYGWSNLNIEGNQCGGKKQSPIAITPSGCNVGANYKMETNKQCSVNDMEYLLGKGGPKSSFPKACSGYTMEIPVLKGAVFEALQFHTHIGSEHVIGGERYGAELHIVHKEKGGDRYAVAGVMINGDGNVDNTLFERLLNKWSAVEAKVKANCDGVAPPATKNLPITGDMFNPYDLIPAGSSFYHYDGSLTTPPCSEVVWWELADGVLHVSPEQLDRLIALTTTYTDPVSCELQTAASPIDGTTNRPIAQDLAGREVQKICPVDSIGSNKPVAVSSADMYPNIVASNDIDQTEYPQTQSAYDPSLLASSRTQFTTDDYDPYAGM